MRMQVYMDGMEYPGAAQGIPEGETLQSVAEKFREMLPNLVTLQMPLADGNILIIGKDAIQKAHFVFVP